LAKSVKAQPCHHVRAEAERGVREHVGQVVQVVLQVEVGAADVEVPNPVGLGSILFIRFG
jgi:hypothetical protein